MGGNTGEGRWMYAENAWMQNKNKNQMNITYPPKLVSDHYAFFSLRFEGITPTKRMNFECVCFVLLLCIVRFVHERMDG